MSRTYKDRPVRCNSMEERRLPAELKKCDHLRDQKKRNKCRRTVSKRSAQRKKECQFF